jgi:5-formyltetrahydrofolate cyclo-ligase
MELTIINFFYFIDCFLERATAANVAAGKPAPVTIGLAFDEQIVESVPLEDHDRYSMCLLNCIIRVSG